MFIYDYLSIICILNCIGGNTERHGLPVHPLLCVHEAQLSPH